MIVVTTIPSCGNPGIKFEPLFHAGDSAHSQIVPKEPYPIVACNDPKFDEFFCMHIDKVKELKELLMRSKLSPKVKKQIEETL